MPVGILVIRDDNEIGPINEGFYPETLKITNNLLTQIYNSHRYQSFKPGFASISLKNNNVLSLLSVVSQDFISVENYIIALILRRGEKPGNYREVLRTITADILEKIPDGTFRENFPKF